MVSCVGAGAAGRRVAAGRRDGPAGAPRRAGAAGPPFRDLLPRHVQRAAARLAAPPVHGRAPDQVHAPRLPRAGDHAAVRAAAVFRGRGRGHRARVTGRAAIGARRVAAARQADGRQRAAAVRRGHFIARRGRFAQPQLPLQEVARQGDVRGRARRLRRRRGRARTHALRRRQEDVPAGRARQNHEAAQGGSHTHVNIMIINNIVDILSCVCMCGMYCMISALYF